MTEAPIPFAKRRTYLDACREQGVFQQREELKAENADLSAELANIRKDKSAEVIIFSQDDRAENSRRGEFLTAFLASELGPESLQFLRHLVLNTDIPGHRAAGLFAATAGDLKKPCGNR